MLVESTTRKDTILTKLRIRPADPPDRPDVAHVPCEHLFELPAVSLGAARVLRRALNFVPYFDLLIGAAGSNSVAIKVKLNIMNEIIVLKAV